MQIRETGGSGPIGADGGTSGTIERTAVPVRIESRDSWQYVYFDLPNETWVASTGNGQLDGSWGTLEALSISAVPSDPTTDFTLYIDDIYQGPRHASWDEDCNSNGVPDWHELATGTSQDCNSNGVPDACDIADGTSNDADGDSQPDECAQPPVDCNGDGILDLNDLPAIAFCLQGPNLAFVSGHFCTCGDADGDMDVDLVDFAIMQSWFPVLNP
jgi:hypothetical protein